jgi:hypothetical protein
MLLNVYLNPTFIVVAAVVELELLLSVTTGGGRTGNPARLELVRTVGTGGAGSCGEKPCPGAEGGMCHLAVSLATS